MHKRRIVTGQEQMVGAEPGSLRQLAPETLEENARNNQQNEGTGYLCRDENISSPGTVLTSRFRVTGLQSDDHIGTRAAERGSEAEQKRARDSNRQSKTRGRADPTRH